MKKLFNIGLSLLLAISLCFIMPVEAEPDYTDTTYWNNRCTGKRTLSATDKEACLAYSKYLQSQNNQLGKQLQDIDKKRADIQANIQKYAAMVAEYQSQIDAKQVEIDAKQAEIDLKQAEIDAQQLKINNKQKEINAKQKEIDATQLEIDALMDRLAKRLEVSQTSMRINKYVDILAGAKTFEDLIRLLNGLNNISQFDKITLEELKVLIEKMNLQKQELEDAKAELQAQKEEMEEMKAALEVEKEVLKDQQEEILALQYEAQIIEEEYLKQKAELQAQYSAIAANIAQKNETMRQIAAAGLLDAIPITGANGWTKPVPGAVRSAGTWFYGGGGVHLGYDFAAAAGTTIVAPGPGVVINSVNGCPTYGGLGNWCTGAGGVAGGGNQVYLLVVVGGNLYGVGLCHMMLGTPIKEGTVVTNGTAIGRVGSSGNSSGPHCHVEITYLGSGSNFSNYAQTWNGDCSFGTGWGYAGYNRRCDAGNGAPCRLRPETVFGY